jgi:hypothetical protein
MSENLNLSDLAIRPSYDHDQIRQGMDDKAKAVWDSVDREKASLRGVYRRLEADECYTEEHRAEQAWAAYESTKQKIAQGNGKLRDQLNSGVRSGQRFSIPMPQGEAVTASDTNKILAQQNEAARILRKLERQDSSAGKSPFKRDRVEVLKEEYGRGLDTDTGGAHGGIICRGVLSACDELGIDTNAVVDSFRKDRHRESLLRAQRNAQALDLIGNSVPEPRFARPGKGRGSNPPKRQSTFLVDKKSEPIISGARRRPWK